MDIKELESFRMSDAIKFHNKLNPALWTEKDELDPEVKDQLMVIAKDFMTELGLGSLKVEDITISGSNAAYSYTPHSDLDLHILVDFNKLPDSEVYQELFNAKKTLYNDTHDITVHGVPVELYVQDTNQPHASLGEYSLLKNEWNKFPVKRRANLDQTETRLKYEKLGELIELAIKTQDKSRIDKVLDIIKRYRKAGLTKTGEFGPENLAFKALRKQGYIQYLWDLKQELHSKELSIESAMDEDWHPNDTPPGPEFKPTMPAGTVRVDVSDVYDWYKLGQNISNLDRVDKSQFGKGPPSTIMAFGDEDIEHKYIKALQSLGLDTTDIDPIDPKQPKGMPRQKVDPTYNVGVAESASGYIPKYLYHATYRPLLKSIKQNGLGGSGAQAKYEDSQPGVTYLAINPDIAISYAETSDMVPDEWLDDIVVLKIPTDKLDHTKLHIDRNVRDNKGDTLEYRGVIPFSSVQLSESASGYIPSDAEKNDPRFKTALTVDIKPNTLKKVAKAFGNKVSRAGIPPTARTNGKISK